MRQIIIARKDLQMSVGKLAAQVAHASMAFITRPIQDHAYKTEPDHLGKYYYVSTTTWRSDVMEQWFQGVFTKTVCEAKNKNQLLKAVTIAEELGLKKDLDFFLIEDACLTELTPEDKETGRTLTCIGFRPLDDETAWKISKKFQLYK